MAMKSVWIVIVLLASLTFPAASAYAQKRTGAPPAPEQARPNQAVPSDRLRSLEERATHGDAEAQYIVGESYSSSVDGQEDAATALMWYFRAATQGHAKAKERLRELVKPFIAVAPPQVPDKIAVASAPHEVAAVPSPLSGLLMASIVLASISLVLSAAALYFSWNRTRRALRDAGLL
jgi:TPR repeat protein